MNTELVAALTKALADAQRELESERVPGLSSWCCGCIMRAVGSSSTSTLLLSRTS